MSYRFEMSQVQKGIYFECCTKNSSDYHIMVTLEVKDIDCKVLEDAGNFLVSEQEALHLCLEETEDTIYMRSREDVFIDIPLVFSENEEETREIGIKTFTEPLDLYKAPLLRINYVKEKTGKNYVLLCMHHLIADGISADIFIKRLFSIYEAMIFHTPFEINMKEDLRFSSFIKKENKKLLDGEYKEQGEFWKKELENISAPEFIKEFSQMDRDKKNLIGSEVQISIPENLVEKMEERAKELEVSEFMFQTAIYMAGIMKCTGSRNFAISSPFTYRPEKKDEEAIGCYIYNTPLFCKKKDSDSFKSLVNEVKNDTFRGYMNIGYPNNFMIREQAIHSLSEKTIFDYTFIYDVYEEHGCQDIIGKKDWDFCVYPGEITVIYEKIGKNAFLRIQYRKESFSQHYMKNFGKRLVGIMEQVCEFPDIFIKDMDIFLPGEREHLWEWERESSFFPLKQECIMDIFEKKVFQYGEEVGVFSREHVFTYKEINDMANAVAEKLLNTKVGGGRKKAGAIWMERCVEMVVSVLGILKAGWAYVPMDLSYTISRIQYIEKDAGLSAILTKEEFLDKVKEEINVELFCVEKIIEEYKTSENPKVVRNPKDVAYIEYTSGSTGEPKGVIIENRNIVNTVKDLERRFPLKKGDVYLFKTPLSFDISGTELFGWIVGEGNLCILPKDEEKDTFAILQTIEKFKVTHINFVPSMLRIFMECLEEEENRKKISSLKWIFTGGEAISNDLVERFLALCTKISLENVYGPTEAPMWATHYPLRHGEKTWNVPIGKALNEYRLYVVDKNMKRVPPMVPGELCISGAGVARGYLNKEEMTKEVFLENPFFEEGDQDQYRRLYKTGDLARMLPDGNYEFLGRMDSQVKVNGIRIELGEIERTFLENEEITESVCLVKKGSHEAHYIVLFYSSKKEISDEQLRIFAENKLSPAFVPSEYIYVENMPRTISEKIDRKALGRMAEIGRKKHKVVVKPKNDLEEAIASVWRKVLNREEIGIDENFFQAGGHSIALMYVHNLLCKNLQMEFPISILLNHPTIEGIAAAIRSKNHKREKPVQKRALKGQRTSKDDIAIVGMALDVPGANSIHEFWTNLILKKDCIHEYTTKELEELGIEKELLNNPNYIRRKGVLDDIEEFDPAFFNITPAEVNKMSPQLRLLYKGVWQAMEDGGIASGLYNDRMGVYIGASDDFVWYQSMLFGNERYSDTYQIYTQSTNHFLATRLSHMFDFKGPGMSILTGCSTSLVTVHLACKALLLKECDAALAGGVTVELPNEGGYLYEPNLMFSKDGKCKPFDDKADGTIFSNGMGIVLLKRLADAKKDHDHIYGIIKGSAVRNDGKSKLSYTAPSSLGQTITLKDAYENAEIEPRTVTYIEAHGTGTKLGDPIEIDSLTQVFGTSQTSYCTVGSVKGNIGHTDTAAGIIGLIKTALCLDKKYLPATLHYETPNQNINFKDSPFLVKKDGEEWKKLKEDIPRRAGINAFGVGGTNVHVVLEENMEEEKKETRQRQYHLFPVSAVTKTALVATMDDISSYIEEKEDIGNLTNAAWSLTTGRKTFANRGFFITEGKKKVDSFIKRKIVNSKEKSICFLFTGQGSQYQGMARELYKNPDHNPICGIFQKYAKKIMEAMPEDEKEEFLEILYGREKPEQINETKYSQIALFLTEYAMASTLMELGIKPDILVGHSIGEVTAGAFAGIWSLEDAVKVVLKRAKLMQEQEPGLMLSVGISREKLESYINTRDNIWLSLCNTTDNCVVGGTKEEIWNLQETLVKDGYICSMLKTSHAFHTPMMSGAAKKFAEFLQTFNMKEPKFKIISNITGNLAEQGQMSQPQYWSEQIIHPVKFEDVLSYTLQEENIVFLETGGRTLCSLAKKHKEIKESHVFIPCIRHPQEKKHDMVHLLGVIGKIWCENIPVHWELLYENVDKKRIYLPTYHFDKKKFPINIHRVKSILHHDICTKTDEKEEISTKSHLVVDDKEILKITLRIFQELFVLEDLDEDSDFFEIGGDSMQAASLAAKLQKEMGISISVSEIFANASPKALAELIQSRRKEPIERKNIKHIPRAKEAEYYPTSPAQRRMYILYRMNKENVAYNLPSVVFIEGSIDVDKARKTFEKLVEHHEILRTSFEWRKNEVVQIIHEKWELPFFVEKITGEFHVEKLVKTFIQPFSLDKAPLMRVKLIQNENQTLMLFDVHHIIADGTAVELLTRDFNRLYTGEIWPIKLQYKDYALWLREYLQSKEMKKQEDYWLENLSGNLSYLDLPTDFKRPEVKEFGGERYEFSLGDKLSNEISRNSRELGVTNFILTMSAWNIVLAKYAGQSEVVIGTSVSGRTTDEMRECIGMFVNMLVIRTFPEGEKCYMDYLKEVKKTVAMALENQEYQFDTLVEKLNIERKLDRSALFEVCFDYHNMEFHDLEVEGLTFKQQELKTGKAVNELLLTCSEDKDRNITCFIDYATSIFKKSTIERMAKSFIKVLEVISNKEKRPLEKFFIKDIPILYEEEKEILEEFNKRTYREYDYSISIPELFKKWVERQPKQTAIITSDGTELTYENIWEKVENLAYILRLKGVNREVPVAIIPHRNENMMIGIFAILYAGGAYVPIDITYPDDRINNMIEKSRTKILLGEREVEKRIKGECIFIDFDEKHTVPKEEEKRRLFDESEKQHPHDLAYILFTSGSMGGPKGVGVTRKNLLNFIYDTQEREIIGQKGDRVCCITTPSFDIFAYESIIPLCSGSSIYICSQMEQLDAKETAKKIVKYKVTHFQSAVSRMRLFVENRDFRPAFHQLRFIMSGGENFPYALLEFLKENTKARIYNMYGPTETTIWSTIKELTNADSVTIGEPIANTRVYITDTKGHLLPRGVFGELCISGDGVSKGYVNGKEETESRFREGEQFKERRVYFTGDRGRLLDSGEIEISGRMDHQVKLHGCRIELEEIEGTAQNSGLVENASAIIRKIVDENHQLYLFYTNKEDVEQQLRNYMAGKLPSYMVPDCFVRMEKLPITRNGKIDRKLLENLSLEEAFVEQNFSKKTDRNNFLLRGEKEKQSVKNRILEIWKGVLHNRNISVNDNFFDVGGNSYSLMFIANKIEELLGISMDLRIFFEYPTIQKLVDYLKLEDEEKVKEEPADRKRSILEQEETKLQEQESLKKNHRKIAVVGMAGRFPEAENIDEFWKNIVDGKESIRFFEDEELREAGIPKSDLENPSYVKAKGYLEDVQYFDADFFGMTRKETQRMDPQIRLFMECCYHALEDANCDLKRYKGDIALFAGSSSNVLWMSKFAGKRDIVDIFSAMTVNDKDFLTTQISYKLNLTGPSMNVQTACSTSLVAICQAAQCLLEGDAHMALAGGVSITYPRKEGYLWHENMIYSKDGHCRPFSEDATGTVSGNGCAVVALKLLEKAVEDRDDIYAVLEGFAINNDGIGKVGYAAPSVTGQRKVIEKALKKARMNPENIGYVEAHGTGTKLGDPVEIEALKQAWKIEKRNYCAIGSVKANIGHLDAAAGVTGFIKAVNVLYHRVIPPTIHFSKPNPRIQIEETPFYVAKEKMELKEEYSYGAVSSFGIGGTNAHAILGVPPKENKEYKNEDIGLLLFSAKTKTSLTKTAKAVFRQMEEKKFPVADVAYTLCVGRTQLPVRAAIVWKGEKPNIPFNEEFFEIYSLDKEKEEDIGKVYILHGKKEELCLFAREIMGKRARHGLVRRFRKILGDWINDSEWKVNQIIEEVIYGEKDILAKEYDEIELMITGAAVEIAFYELLQYCGVKDILFEQEGIGRIAEEVIKKGINLNEAWNIIEQDRFLFNEKGERGDGREFLSVSIGKSSYEEPMEAQEELLKTIGNLWAKGCKLEMEKLNQGRKRHIHGYVFDKEEFDGDVSPFFQGKAFQMEAEETVIKRSADKCRTKEEVFHVLSSIWEEVLGEKDPAKDRDFFEAGGDSLNSIRMAVLIEEYFGLSIPQEVLFEKTMAGEIAAWIYENICEGRDRKEVLKNQIVSLDAQPFYETSSGQKRIYTVQSMDPQSTAYNLAAVYTVEGKIDEEKVKESVQKLVERHEAFRTYFGLKDGEIVQYITESMTPPIEFVKEEGKKAPSLKELVREFVQPFDLEKAPLLRMKVVHIQEDKHYFLMDMHHIISDQSSIDILMKDFYAIYQGEHLLPLTVHFKDFAAWQNKRIKGGEMDRQLTYWMDQLGKERFQRTLHYDYLTPGNRSFSGKKLHFKWDALLCEKLTTFSKNHNVTPYMVLFLTLELLFWKYTEEKRFVIGTAVEGRRNPSLQNIVGMFVNTLAIFTSIHEEKNIKEELEHVKKTILTAFENQDCQFETVVEELRNRTGIKEPFLPVMMNYVTKGTQEMEVEGLKMQYHDLEDITAKFDLMFVFEKCGNSHALDIEYGTELFAEETIRQMGQRFLDILAMIMDNDQLSVKQVTLPLTKQDEMLYEKVSNLKEMREDKSIAEIFEEVAKKEGERIALKSGKNLITYQQLNYMANFIAMQLKEKEVKRHDRVALVLEQGILQMASILGVLKCGASYLPIDPQYPKNRREFMLSDSNAKAVIVEEGGICEGYTKELVINEELLLEGMKKKESEQFAFTEELSIDDEAYIIYTSGSTGSPKGVSVGGRSILRIAYDPNYVEICPGDCIVQLASYAFDASIFEMFTPILKGACCLFIPKDILLDFPRLEQMISGEKIKAAFITTALFNMIVDYDVRLLKNVDKIFVGGEVLSVSHMKQAFKELGKGHLHNIYGPTEATVFSTFYPIDEIEDHGESIPIGHGISDTTLYVLDNQGRLLPWGIPGELCIGGSGLAKGYLNNEDQTKEKFVHISFGNKERVYKTGDRVILRNDGELIYIGRKDFQVKINGFRIELKEVEKYLDSMEGVKESVALVQKDSQGVNYITAYYTLQEKKYEYLTPQYIRSYLQNLIPEYMIPEKIVYVEEMPLNANKKIDSEKLKQISSGSPLDQRGMEEQKVLTGSVKYVLDTLREVLGNPGMEPEDNFFHSGGNSMRAIALAQKFREAGYDVGVKNILTYTTAADLAKMPVFQGLNNKGEKLPENTVGRYLVRKGEPEELDGVAAYSCMAGDILPKVLQKKETKEEFPMSAIQKLHLGKKQRVSGLRMVIHTTKELEDVKEAIAKEVYRHQLLHGVADFENKVWQEKEIDISVKHLAQYVNVVDVTKYDDDTKEILEKRIQTNLASQAPKSGEVMWRLCCLKESNEKYVIIWIFDHICFDGMSAEIIRQDLSHMLKQQENNEALPLEKPQKYSDYVKDRERDFTHSFQDWKEDVQHWKALNSHCIASMKKRGGSIKQIEMYMEIEKNGGEAFDLALKNTIGFLQSYLEEKEIPMMVLHYGRGLKDKDYYYCVGEFLDMVPVIFKEKNYEEVIEKALKKKKGGSFLDALANTDENQLFEEFYSKEKIGKFIFWNFQGYIERKEYKFFDETIESDPMDILADFVIGTSYDERGIYVHLESVFGFDRALLKSAISNTDFQLEKEVER